MTSNGNPPYGTLNERAIDKRVTDDSKRFALITASMFI